MKLFKLHTVPFLIFLGLLIVPFFAVYMLLTRGFASVFAAATITPSLYMLEFIDSALRNMQVRSSLATFIIFGVLYIVIIFGIAKIINIFFNKKI